MDEQSPLMKNIDKVAYGVAGVLGLAVLALPFLLGGDLPTEASALAKDVDVVKEKRSSQKPEKSSSGSRGLEESLKDQWNSGLSDAPDAVWITEQQPILVRKEKAVEQVPATHGAGMVERLALGRNPDKKVPFIEVTGKVSPEDAHVEYTRIALYRTVDGGDPALVPGFKAEGDFVYEDYNVKPGATYGYHFVSQARSVDKGLHPLDEAAMEQATDPVVATGPVPHDVTLKITFTRPGAGGALMVSAKKELFNYDSGEIEKDKKSKVYKEGDYLDAAKRWQIKRITKGARGAAVRIRDSVVGRSDTIEQRAKRTVQGFDPVEGGAAAEEEGGTEEDTTEVEDDTTEEETTPEPPKKKSGRRRNRIR